MTWEEQQLGSLVTKIYDQRLQARSGTSQSRCYHKEALTRCKWILQVGALSRVLVTRLAYVQILVPAYHIQALSPVLVLTSMPTMYCEECQRIIMWKNADLGEQPYAGEGNGITRWDWKSNLPVERPIHTTGLTLSSELMVFSIHQDHLSPRSSFAQCETSQIIWMRMLREMTNFLLVLSRPLVSYPVTIIRKAQDDWPDIHKGHIFTKAIRVSESMREQSEV